MANKSIKRPFCWKRYKAVLKLRGETTKHLGDPDEGVGWSARTIARAKHNGGQINKDLLLALAKRLDVEPDYLSGKYDLMYEEMFPAPRTAKEEAILESMLQPEHFPYYYSKGRMCLEDTYLTYLLEVHDISRRQYDEMPESSQIEFVKEVELAICPVIQKFFSHDAIGQEGLPELYRLWAEAENYDSDEPDEPDVSFLTYYPDRFQERNK